MKNLRYFSGKQSFMKTEREKWIQTLKKRILTLGIFVPPGMLPAIYDRP